MRSIHGVAGVVAVALVLICSEALAAQALGAQVYPGAQPLPGKTARVRAATGGAAECYRTADGAAAVRAFYVESEGFVVQDGVLRRGNVDVVVHDGPRTDFCIMTATP